MINDKKLTHWKDRFSNHVKDLQNAITDKMLSYDKSLRITEDKWEREDFKGNPGGGGVTRAFKGELFENAGVNTSLIYGDVNPEFAKKLGTNSTKVWATGISLILHPYNPRLSLIHI